MSRLLLSTAVTGATVHATLVQATRPELKFTVEQDPQRGLLGRLDMKNNTRASLAFENGRFSGQRDPDMSAQETNLEGVGKLRHRVFRSSNQQWCFQVLEEYFWDQMKAKQQQLMLHPGDTCKLAVVQFGFADTADDVTKIALREARHLDAQFHVVCYPLPRLVPGYAIGHSFKLADVIAKQ
jgi:hypothetical protein